MFESDISVELNFRGTKPLSQSLNFVCPYFLKFYPLSCFYFFIYLFIFNKFLKFLIVVAEGMNDEWKFFH